MLRCQRFAPGSSRSRRTSGGLSARAGAVTAPVHRARWRRRRGLADRAGAFAGNAGQRAGCCPCSSRDPRAPGSAPCRCIQAPREVRKSRLAPDIGKPGRGSLPPLAQRRGRGEAVRGRPHVCDRYSACKKLARLWLFIILCYCRAHCRRDFPDCAGRSWRGGNGSIAEICRLNTARVPCFRRRSRPRRRRWRLRSLFAEAPRLPKAAPEGRPLRSTIACSSTMDNNFGERTIRGRPTGEARLRFRQHGRLSCTRHGREERPRCSALA